MRKRSSTSLFLCLVQALRAAGRTPWRRHVAARPLVLVLVLALVLVLSLVARGVTAHSGAAPQARAAVAESAPALDGAVIGDPVWANVPVATGFVQTRPDAGAAATQRTEVRVAHTRNTLFIGVVCYDEEPEQIIVAESRRDASLDETDSFLVVLDTFLDQQNGFVFGTNPAGIEFDGQVSRGAGGFNLNWDASWSVKTQRGDFGWSAEFAIPFRSLRFSEGRTQVWGVNFQRNIRRRKETAFWAPLPRQFDLYRLDVAGTLTGIDTGRQRNLKLAPYVLGDVTEDRRLGTGRETSGEIGGDLKYSVTAGLTLDVTVNTDFAQVEADEQQINLDRFNLFFPEKRPFFLENAGHFAVGVGGETELFFSRRIGIGPDGRPVPILGGARLSGKLAGFNVGLLDMQTRSVSGVTPANNFAVARLERELPNRSSLGAIFVNRQATGGEAGNEDHNRTLGVDTRWGVGRYGELSGFFARTWTPGIAADDEAFRVRAEHDSPGWILNASYSEVGEGFNPEAGFLRRKGFRSAQGLIFHRLRPRALWGLQELRPHVSYSGFWKPDGFQESGFLHIDNHWEWKSGHEVHTGVNFTREGLREGFEIFPGVVVAPDTYDHVELGLVAFSNRGAPLSVETSLTVGGFFGGHRVAISPSLKARLGPEFNLDVTWNRNDVDLPGGTFVTNLLRARLSYSFTPRVFVQALVQYNDRISNWSTNLRFGWLQSANMGLFIVYNENREAGSEAALGLRDRALTVKFSRLIDLLGAR